MEKILHYQNKTRISKTGVNVNPSDFPDPNPQHTFTPIRDITVYRNDRNFSNPFGWRRQVVRGI